MKQLGMIGVGNMGGAILQGMLSAGCVCPEDMMVCVHRQEQAEALQSAFSGLTAVTDATALASECHMVILAIKPQGLGELLTQIAPVLPGESAIVSIAAGWTMQMLVKALNRPDVTILRAMPNTPALVGCGMTAICQEHTLTDSDFLFVKRIFDAVGKTEIVSEKLFDGVIAISGSSPAYVFMMIEAMADAGVREGLPRKLAYTMAAQAVYGSAQMVLATGKHPAQLKDDVCSPAGTTIDAVATLEKCGFRTAVQDAMYVCAEKSRKMSK